MPAARGVKRSSSKASTSVSASSSAPKIKKKRSGVVHLEIPTLPTVRCRILTSGTGDVGQLGLGEDVPETTRFRQVQALGDNMVACCAGGMHTVTLDYQGNVWTFGCNDEGALGRPTGSDADEGAPTKVKLPSAAKVVAISAGDSHSAALTDSGHVYAWGSFRDSHGSMGLVVSGRAGKPCKEPALIDLPEPAAEIASGGDHLVMLTVSGAVYTVGCGEQGQLGRLSQRSASRDARSGFSALLTPSKVTIKGAVSRIWAGYHATFAQDAAGDKMYAWGLNNYSQLGISGEKRKTALYTPTECDLFGGEGAQRWAAVACGQHHTVALDEASVAHALGRCEYGRLGLGDRAGDAVTLEPIPALADKKVVSIAAGTSSSFAVTDAGAIYAWGMGSEGQLGSGSSEDAAAPLAVTSKALQGLRVRAVTAGGQHTALVAEDPSAPPPAAPEPAETAPARTVSAPARTVSAPALTGAAPAAPAATSRQNRRQKRTEEDEVSSTSSASASGSDLTLKKKETVTVNGKDKKEETPMEVDETDKTTDTTPTTETQKNDDDTTMEQDKPEPAPEKPSETTPEQKPEETKAEQKPAETAPENKPETTSETETKTAETKDVEMKEDKPVSKETVNGTPEVEEKKDISIPEKSVTEDKSLGGSAIASA